MILGAWRTVAAMAVAMVIAGTAADVRAANPAPYPGTKVIETRLTYGKLVDRLLKAVRKHRMGIVARASATLGAKSIGVTIPGNMVVMVFRPDFAVRMLKASVPAGIEAPLRFYITEGKNGRTTLTYRMPSSVFRPYKSPDLDRMAAELDKIFAKIANDAIGR